MTFDEVKKRLEELSNNKKLLRIMQRRLEELREQVSLSAIDYARPVVQGGICVTPQEKYIERMDKLTDDFSRLLDKVMADEDLINDSASLLSPTEYAIIIERYLHNKPWRKIQNEFNYADSQPYKINDRAIEKILRSRNMDSK